MNFIIKTLATGLGLGYIPGMPGTYGTVLAMGLLWGLRSLDLFQYLAFVIVFFFLSVWISTQAEKLFGERDCQKIVIDEVAGLLVTFIAIPLNWVTMLAGFVLFRFFDITKIPPIYQSQRLKKGWGIVVDDILAGVFANIVLQIVLTLWYLKAT